MASVRQLLVISSLVIACILISMLAVGTSLMQRKLDIQMQTEGENAVTTMALLVSAQADVQSRDEVLQAAFQQGRFAQLELRAPDGSELFSARHAQHYALGVPGWFTAWLDIAPHHASRHLPGIGDLSLVLDTGYAREALWTHVVQWTWLALGIGGFWALFIASLLARLRQEITMLIAAASPEIKLKPEPDDHLQEAELVDEPAERIAPTVEEQMARVERLELELNQDPVTGLANRLYFLNELKRVLRDDARQGAVSGYVLLVRQRDMARVQNQTDRHELDNWLQLLGSRVLELLAQHSSANALAGRLNGSDLVILFPVGGGPEVMRAIQALQDMLETMRIKLDSHHLSRWAFALTDYTSRCTTKDVLTRLDQALMHAESAGHGEVEFLSYTEDDDGQVRMGEASWRMLITQALEQDRLSLRVAALAYEGEEDANLYEGSLVLHEEEPGQPPLPGNLFMPAAMRLGLSSACDLRCLCLALGWLGEHPEGILIVRVSVSSLLDYSFVDEITQVCKVADPTLIGRIIIELDAFGLSKHAESFMAFARAAVDLGLHLGLRGLDRQADALGRLHEIDLAYIRLGGNFVQQMLSSPGGTQMMIAMTQTAIGMGIRVYVDDADDEGTRKLVQEYGALPRKPGH